MVGQRREKNAENDGHRCAETGGQQDGEQLRLVANLGERNDGGGCIQGFH
jgi:hypothetical protein